MSCAVKLEYYATYRELLDRYPRLPLRVVAGTQLALCQPVRHPVAPLRLGLRLRDPELHELGDVLGVLHVQLGELAQAEALGDQAQLLGPVPEGSRAQVPGHRRQERERHRERVERRLVVPPTAVEQVL